MHHEVALLLDQQQHLVKVEPLQWGDVVVIGRNDGTGGVEADVEAVIAFRLVSEKEILPAHAREAGKSVSAVWTRAWHLLATAAIWASVVRLPPEPASFSHARALVYIGACHRQELR